MVLCLISMVILTNKCTGVTLLLVTLVWWFEIKWPQKGVHY